MEKTIKIALVIFLILSVFSCEKKKIKKYSIHESNHKDFVVLLKENKLPTETSTITELRDDSIFIRSFPNKRNDSILKMRALTTVEIKELTTLLEKLPQLDSIKSKYVRGYGHSEYFEIYLASKKDSKSVVLLDSVPDFFIKFIIFTQEAKRQNTYNFINPKINGLNNITISKFIKDNDTLKISFSDSFFLWKELVMSNNKKQIELDEKLSNKYHDELLFYYPLVHEGAQLTKIYMNSDNFLLMYNSGTSFLINRPDYYDLTK